MSPDRLGRSGECQNTKVNEAEVAWLLEDLCVALGFCLTQDSRDRLIRSSPLTVRAFVDAIAEAEGLDPATLEKEIHHQLSERIDRSFTLSRRIGSDG